MGPSEKPTALSFSEVQPHIAALLEDIKASVKAAPAAARKNLKITLTDNENEIKVTDFDDAVDGKYTLTQESDDNPEEAGFWDQDGDKATHYIRYKNGGWYLCKGCGTELYKNDEDAPEKV